MYLFYCNVSYHVMVQRKCLVQHSWYRAWQGPACLMTEGLLPPLFVKYAANAIIYGVKLFSLFFLCIFCYPISICLADWHHGAVSNKGCYHNLACFQAKVPSFFHILSFVWKKSSEFTRSLNTKLNIHLQSTSSQRTTCSLFNVNLLLVLEHKTLRISLEEKLF